MSHQFKHNSFLARGRWCGTVGSFLSNTLHHLVNQQTLAPIVLYTFSVVLGKSVEFASMSILCIKFKYLTCHM